MSARRIIKMLAKLRSASAFQRIESYDSYHPSFYATYYRDESRHTGSWGKYAVLASIFRTAFSASSSRPCNDSENSRMRFASSSSHGGCFRCGGHHSRDQGGDVDEQIRAVKALFQVGALLLSLV